MKNKLLATILLLSLFTSILTVATQVSPVAAQNENVQLYIDPPLIEKYPSDVCTYFNVTVMIANVTDLFGFDINITYTYDPLNRLITFNHCYYNETLDAIWGAGNWFLAKNESGEGWYKLVAVSTSNGFTIDPGSQALFHLEFHVEDAPPGEASIHFEMAKLSNPQWESIPVETIDGTYRMISAPQWYTKPPYPDYAQSGMPDFDQRQWGTYNWTDPWNAWSHCGPVAVANSIWWFDSKYESLNNTNPPVPPPTISDNFSLVTSYNQGVWDDHDPQNVQPLIEHLAWLMDCDGMRTGPFTGVFWSGTYVDDMETGIAQYLSWSGVNPLGDVNGDGVVDTTDQAIVNNAMGTTPGQPGWNLAADIYPATTSYPPTTDNVIDNNDLDLVLNNLGKTGMFYEHTVHALWLDTEFFYYIEEEVEKSQDVVLLLGIYYNGYREYGHYVTVAGVNSSTLQLLISDPIGDEFEAGNTPGRSPVPHQHLPPEPPYTTHNNASLVSHDAYTALYLPDHPSGYHWALEVTETGWAAMIEYAVITSPKIVKPDLEIIPPEVTCRKYCENFTVQINVTHAVNVHDFHFEIMYNTTLLDYVSVDWGELGPGTITVYETLGLLQGQIVPADPWVVVNGNQTLLNITFHAAYYHIWKDESVCDWVNDLTGRIWFHWAQLTYLEGEPLTYEEDGPLKEIDVYDAWYTFSPIQGDINNDGSVNILDISLVAWYYEQAYPAYDLNCDGVIDIFDLVIIAANLWFEHDC